ncbi:3-dehydroquinate synthase [Actinomyces weissii]|uniref:3-dehydroquinate synthase n=1 Tax=Actinomyces weissii TaxID=675090 RepID=UPI001F202DA2|nr:3-dehydroquinate synthase [Actinomyces weissii]
MTVDNHSRLGPQQLRLEPGRLPIVLVGLPGAGKTTVARLLATALGVQVTDTDAEIRRRARMTVPQIFQAEGEEGFRDRETRALRYVLLGQDHAKGVLALGGGAVEREANRVLLHGRTVVFLDAQPQTAAQHVGVGEGRPLMGREADSDAAAGGEALSTAEGVLARMREFDARRRPLYEEVATLTVPTDGLTPEQVAALVLVGLGGQAGPVARSLSTWQRQQAAADAAAAAEQPGPSPRSWPGNPRSIQVTGQHPYEVLIGHGLEATVARAVKRAPGGGEGGVAIIHAAPLQTAARRIEQELAEEGRRVTRIEVAGNESSKQAAVLEQVWEQLGGFRLGRDGAVVGLGGGATTDLAGFAAATWLRGVPVVQVPTSLLAMVDAAVGGKTGIDTAAGKNLVGAFHPPATVVCDLDTLKGLPVEELRCGLAEVIKCGLIADPVILDRVLADPADCLHWDSPVLAELVERSVAVKAAVVSADLREAGLREVLNYGHTYAHAVEKLTGYQWRHGEAVAVGCVFAAKVARRCGLLDADTVRLHREAFQAVGLPCTFPPGAGRWEELEQVMLSDKKVRGGVLRMVLLEAVGMPRLGMTPAPEVLRSAHEAVAGTAWTAEPQA